MHIYTGVFGLALKTLNTRSEASPYSRYFIANAYDLSMKKIKSPIAEDLKRRGLIENAEVVSAAYDGSGISSGYVYVSYKPTYIILISLSCRASLIAANTVCVARRSKEMFGWEPKERTFEEFVAGNVDAYLASMA